MQTRREFGKLVLGSLAATVAAPVTAIDWPQWRGPNQDGISPETGLLQHWPKEGPRLAWHSGEVGFGYSTVATARDRILTSGDLNGKSTVIALNAKDGARVWATPVGAPGSLGCCNSDGPRSTPTVDAAAGLVFALAQHGEVAALNFNDGNIAWTKHLASDFGGPVPEWGYSSEPVVDGDKLLLTPGGSKGAVIALDKKTGNTLWRTTELTDSPHYSTLVIATLHGVKQYIQLTDASLAGINPADGKLLWKAPRRGATAVIPTPVVFNDLIYVTSGYGIGCHCFKVEKTGQNWAANEVYANKIMVNHHGGVIRVGPNVYGHSDSKGWTCQDIKTGNLHWQDKSFGKGSVAYADNRLILRREDGPGTIALIEASPAGYKEHGRFDPPNRSRRNSWAHPVISNGKLYIRDQEHLLCYDVSAKS